MRWHSTLALIIVIGNVIDAVATLWFVRNGYAQELNPIMQWALDQGDLVFIGFKSMILPCTYLLWKMQHKVGLALCAVVYVGITLLYVYNTVAFLLWRYG